MVVSRHLPDRLTVKLIERHPVALLQTPAGHQLIDEAGVIIDGADVSAFSHLVVVSGTGQPHAQLHCWVYWNQSLKFLPKYGRFS